MNIRILIELLTISAQRIEDTNFNILFALLLQHSQVAPRNRVLSRWQLSLKRIKKMGIVK